jgi:serine O-acetyltransferase
MMNDVSAENPDWRKFWDPGRKLLRAIRRYQALKKNGGLFADLRSKYWVLVYRFWSVVCGAEIDLTCDIGGELLIPHPNGIVIRPKAVIGPNCLLFQ